MNSAASERQMNRCGHGHECLAFAGLHLSNAASRHRHRGLELNIVESDIASSSQRFAGERQSGHKNMRFPCRVSSRQFASHLQDFQSKLFRSCGFESRCQRADVRNQFARSNRCQPPIHRSLRRRRPRSRLRCRGCRVASCHKSSALCLNLYPSRNRVFRFFSRGDRFVPVSRSLLQFTAERFETVAGGHRSATMVRHSATTG